MTPSRGDSENSGNSTDALKKCKKNIVSGHFFFLPKYFTKVFYSESLEVEKAGLGMRDTCCV